MSVVLKNATRVINVTAYGYEVYDKVNKARTLYDFRPSVYNTYKASKLWYEVVCPSRTWAASLAPHVSAPTSQPIDRYNVNLQFFFYL